MITVTFFLWFDPAGKYNARHVYRPEHVNRLKREVAANLALPHEFVVVSDRPDGFDSDIRVVPIDRTLIRDGKRWPKLMIYRPDAGALIGWRILALDIDADVHGPLAPLVDRPEAFVGWKNPNPSPRHTILNSSIVLLTAGARRQVWDSFDLDEAAAFAVADRRGGSDQSHVSRILGEGEAMWTEADGIYWSRTMGDRVPAAAGMLGDRAPAAAGTLGDRMPVAARIVFHAGWEKPARFNAC